VSALFSIDFQTRKKIPAENPSSYSSCWSSHSMRNKLFCLLTSLCCWRWCI
jgi:hypothetical protein